MIPELAPASNSGGDSNTVNGQTKVLLSSKQHSHGFHKCWKPSFFFIHISVLVKASIKSSSIVLLRERNVSCSWNDKCTSWGLPFALVLRVRSIFSPKRAHAYTLIHARKSTTAVNILRWSCTSFTWHIIQLQHLSLYNDEVVKILNEDAFLHVNSIYLLKIIKFWIKLFCFPVASLRYYVFLSFTFKLLWKTYKSTYYTITDMTAHCN